VHTKTAGNDVVKEEESSALNPLPKKEESSTPIPAKKKKKKANRSKASSSQENNIRDAIEQQRELVCSELHGLSFFFPFHVSC